jgi:hypothetical protein
MTYMYNTKNQIEKMIEKIQEKEAELDARVRNIAIRSVELKKERKALEELLRQLEGNR